MAVRKTSEIIKALLSKGFKRRDGDHIYLHYYSLNGKKTVIFTKISRGKKEYGPKLLSYIQKQLKLQKDQLLDLIDCPLSREDYEKILRDKRFIE